MGNDARHPSHYASGLLYAAMGAFVTATGLTIPDGAPIEDVPGGELISSVMPFFGIVMAGFGVYRMIADFGARRTARLSPSDTDETGIAAKPADDAPEATGVQHDPREIDGRPRTTDDRVTNRPAS